MISLEITNYCVAMRLTIRKYEIRYETFCKYTTYVLMKHIMNTYHVVMNR